MSNPREIDHFNARIPAALMAQLRVMAESRKVTVAQLVRDAVALLVDSQGLTDAVRTTLHQLTQTVVAEGRQAQQGILEVAKAERESNKEMIGRQQAQIAELQVIALDLLTKISELVSLASSADASPAAPPRLTSSNPTPTTGFAAQKAQQEAARRNQT